MFNLAYVFSYKTAITHYYPACKFDHLHVYLFQPPFTGENRKKTIDKVSIHALFDLILYVPVNNLSVMSGRVSLGWTSTKQR